MTDQKSTVKATTGLVQTNISNFDNTENNIEILEIDENNTEQDEETEKYEEEEISPSEALNNLKVFAAQELSSTRLLPTEYCGALAKPIRLIEEMLGIPPQNAFFKAVFKKEKFKENSDQESANKAVFQGFRYPDLALHDGKISLIYHSKVFDVEKFFLANAKTPKSQCEFDFYDGRLCVKFSHPKDDVTRIFLFNVFVAKTDLTKDNCDVLKLQRNPSYLKNVLSPYTFPVNFLEDGRYPVQSVNELKGSWVAKLSTGMEVYLSGYIAANLKDASSSGEEMALIVDGLKANNPEYKNIYAEGYPSAVSIGDFAVKLAKEKGYDVVPDQPFPEPIQVRWTGIQNTMGREGIPPSFVLQLEIDGRKHNVYPNKNLKTARKNGTFKLKSFDDVYLVIHSTGLYTKNEKTYVTTNLTWEIPKASKELDSSFDEMRKALGGLI